MNLGTFIFGDKIYRYKQPLLGLVNKANKIWNRQAKEGASEEEAEKVFIENWKEWVGLVIENPDEAITDANNLMQAEVGEIIAGFQRTAGKTTRIRSAVSETSGDSKA